MRFAQLVSELDPLHQRVIKYLVAYLRKLVKVRQILLHLIFVAFLQWLLTRCLARAHPTDKDVRK